MTVSISRGWIRTAALASTIEFLQLRQSGQWLDRFGKTSAYAW